MEREQTTRFRCDVEYLGQRSTLYVDAANIDAAAARAGRSARFDLTERLADRSSGADLDGPYARRVFRGARPVDLVVVRVRIMRTADQDEQDAG